MSPNMFGYFAVFYKRYRIFLALERSKFKLDDFVKTYVSFKELITTCPSTRAKESGTKGTKYYREI